MVDISVYNDVGKYETLQYLRPDYAKTIAVSLEFAKKYSNSRDHIIVSDFCCGTGSNTKKFAEMVNGLKKAVLVDINKKFLEIAKSLKIQTEELEIIYKNVLDFVPRENSDIVFSIFAYHHIEDNKKSIFVEKVKTSLNNNGIIILAEIYIPTKEIGRRYYEKLFNEIPKEKVIPGLKEFLTQTAKSDDFEFKVSKDFAEEQFLSAGFTKIDEEKIWPLDNSFDKNIGTFVQVFKK